MESSLTVASSLLSASVQPISGVIPSIMSVRRRGILSWKSVALLVVMMVVSSEAQTFQYSRGWTNGKRNGGMNVSPYEAVESGLAGVDPLDMIIPPGHLQMNLVPQGRFRSLDYNQLVAKRMALAGSTYGNYNAKKQPLWFGTILGLDGADSQSAGLPVSSVVNPVSSSNTNTVSSSRSSTADF